MTTHTWGEIKAKKFSAEQIQQIDDAVEQELLEMDLRALREAGDIIQEKLGECNDRHPILKCPKTG